MKKLIAAAVMLALAAGEACAQTPQPNFPPHYAFMRVVALCVDEVRAKQSGHTNFEAYVVPATGNANSWGSKQEQWQFEKCLTLKGHPTSEIISTKGTPK